MSSSGATSTRSNVARLLAISGGIAVATGCYIYNEPTQNFFGTSSVDYKKVFMAIISLNSFRVT
jgi:hypothetical protein